LTSEGLHLAQNPMRLAQNHKCFAQKPSAAPTVVGAAPD
jgi:hypothetical protein